MRGNLKTMLPKNLWQFTITAAVVFASLLAITGIILALLYYNLRFISSDAAVTILGAASENVLLIIGVLLVPAVASSWFLTRIVIKNRQLKNRLAMNESLLEMVDDFVFIHDLKGKCVFASKLDRGNGRSTRDELMGMVPQALNDLVYSEIIKPRIAALMETHATVFKSTHIRRDSSLIPVEVNSRIIESGNRNFILSVVRNVTERKRTEEELLQSSKKLLRAMNGTINSMASISEVRDPYTAGHQQRVAKLAIAIAQELSLSEERIEGIRVAGILHDIGKICVPAEILSKPGRLKRSEFDLVKDHVAVGYGLLKAIEFSCPVAEIVLQHHERMDGSGYPHGLSGDNILIEARIMGVADVIESMSSHRPYRPAFSVEKALLEIVLNKDVLYDPKVVDACVRLFNERGFLFN